MTTTINLAVGIDATVQVVEERLWPTPLLAVDAPAGQLTEALRSAANSGR
jgi:hypothetical protein